MLVFNRSSISSILLNGQKPLFRIFIFYIVSFLFLLFCSRTTSFLCDDPGADTIIYRFAASGWLDGVIPYQDFFDNKGPYFYLLYVLGMFIHKGTFGLFLIQTLVMVATLECLWRISVLMAPNRVSVVLAALMAYLWFCFIFFDGGGLTEDMSAPFIALPLLLYFKDLLENRHHPVSYALIYGLCFGVLVLVRLNNALINAGLIFWLCCVMLRDGNYSQLLKNACAFLVGFSIAVIPMVYYFWSNNALDDLIYSTYIFNYKYAQLWAGIGGKSTMSIVLSDLMLLFPLILGSIFAFYYCKTNKKQCIYPGLAISAALIVYSFIRTANYPHYFMIEVPLLFVFSLFVFDSNRLKKAIWWILIGSASIIYLVPLTLKENVASIVKCRATKAINISEMVKTYVPAEEMTDIYTIGLFTENAAFEKLGVRPACKHPFNALTYSKIDERIAADIAEDMTPGRHKWAIAPAGKNQYDYLFENYEPLDTVENVILYRRNDQHSCLSQ